MDLNEALWVVSAPIHVNGQSDAALVRRIEGTKGYIPPAKPVSPASGILGGTILRPVEALHRLSYATRPLYQDDVFDRYVHWALLRYMGFFSHGAARAVGALLVSDAGRRIVGNQRRLASEEMGIGFGTLLGARWFDHDLGSPGYRLASWTSTSPFTTATCSPAARRKQ